MSSDEDGGLGSPGGVANQSRITVPAVSTWRGGICPCSVQAQIDFPRPTGQDTERPFRNIYVQVHEDVYPREGHVCWIFGMLVVLFSRELSERCAPQN
jgi:hypothetical protein